MSYSNITSNASHQFITKTIHGFDFQFGAGFFQFFAQVFELGVNKVEIVGLIDRVAPHGFGQYALFDQAVRAVHEVNQDVVFLTAEVYQFTVHLHLEAVGVYTHVGIFQQGFAIALFAAQHAFQAGVQFGQMEGFGQVVVGTQIQSGHLVFDRILGRKDNDIGHTVTFLLQVAQKVESVAIGQHDVEQNAVVFVHQGFLPCRFVSVGGFHKVAFFQQGAFGYFAQIGIVFNYKYFHGAKISSYGVSEGFLDYQCMAEMAQAESIDIYSEEYEDACWELYNGEDCYYYDSDGHTYDYECCIERIEELKDMIANARGEQDVSKWEKDIDSLTYNCECIGICDYMEITEEAARIMKESGSDEIVYYSKELDMYIWGITHYGTSWKLMLTSIPIPEDNAA